MSAIIADFGKNKDGLNLYRINGTEAEIMNAIEQLKQIGCEVFGDFELEKSHGNWTVLLKVQVPMVGETKE